VHPNAVADAEAVEAAALQGKRTEFAKSLFADQDHQMPSDILRRAEELGLDVDKFERDLRSPEVTARVRDDMLDAEAMDITSVPTFFINGKRHTGPYDAQSLIRALLATAPDQDEARAAQPEQTAAGERQEAAEEH
jgi:predicted DsbA family dithiol-disulfide isomerase